MSHHFAIPSYSFATSTSLPSQVTFDGGRLTSDGGLPLLAQADYATGLCDLIASLVPDWRMRQAQHSLDTLVRQRISQIACGYEAQDDADTLRHDPLLKLVCGRLPALALQCERDRRLLAGGCKLCGVGGAVGVHHIRKLADLRQPGRRTNTIG